MPEELWKSLIKMTRCFICDYRQGAMALKWGLLFFLIGPIVWFSKVPLNITGLLDFLSNLYCTFYLLKYSGETEKFFVGYLQFRRCNLFHDPYHRGLHVNRNLRWFEKLRMKNGRNAPQVVSKFKVFITRVEILFSLIAVNASESEQHALSCHKWPILWAILSLVRYDSSINPCALLW